MGISNNTLANNIIVQGLGSPDKDEVVYEGTNGYNTMTYLFDKLTKASGGSKQIQNFKWTNFTMGTIQVTSACTAAATLSGVNLIVTVADASNFRVNDVVADNNMVMGIVVSTTATTITLAPTSVAFVAATHFTSTMTAKVMGDASQKTASAGKSSLVYTPNSSDALITVVRAGNTQNGDDRVKTYPMKNGKAWYSSQDQFTLMDFGRTKEKLAAFSVQVENVNGGNTNMTAGLRWSIYNKGGTATIGAGAWTELNVQNHISAMVEKKAGGRGRRYLVAAGNRWIANFQANISKQYVLTAGTSSIFKELGATKGLNIWNYAFGGAELEIIPWAMLDDPYLWSGNNTTVPGMTGGKWSNSAWFLDMSDLPTIGGGTKPIVQQRHVGDKEIYTTYLNGLGTDISDEEIIAADGRDTIVSDVDSRSLQILSRFGWNMEGVGLGIMEPQS